MCSRLTWYGVGITALVMLCTGCMGPDARVTAPTETLPTLSFERVDLPFPDDVAPPAYRLGPGDILEVELLGQTNSREDCPIGVDGFVYYGPHSVFLRCGQNAHRSSR